MARFWTGFDFTLHAIVGLIVFALAIVGVMQVFFRYVIQSSLAWTEELSRVLLIWLVLLAAAAELHRGAHIAMKLLVAYSPPAFQLWVERFNLVATLIFSMILVIFGLKLVDSAMSQTATILPISMGQIYLALPIGGAIMTINALRLLWEGWHPVSDPAATGDVV